MSTEYSNDQYQLKKRKLSEININVSKNTSIKRIFPGPAGLLADHNALITPSQAISQNTSTIFQDGPWQDMLNDFQVTSNVQLYDQFNIAWIKSQAAKDNFKILQVPFLAGVLINIDVCDRQKQKSQVSITLKDLTGIIKGDIVSSLYDEYASSLTFGAVVTLTQVGVLSCTCHKCDNHHLTITPKNLTSIYNNGTKLVIRDIRVQDILIENHQNDRTLLDDRKSEDPLAIKLKKTFTFKKPSINSDIDNYVMAVTALEQLQDSKQLPSMEYSETLIEAHIDNEVIDENSSFQIDDGQVSLKVNDINDEKVWKEALAGVDLSFLFDNSDI
ncbi:hypothetical protein ABEB36_007726 [Hypothenemus hampei]|uniref:Homologous recombination OB-fold protein OB-fold domain-containing protein n=1 Tax=Hypothenemus hampei TaxID=57062 RepID=A0ABD1EV18_HYPHA